jgi:uncharacterized protein (TIGR02145 family)
MKILFMWPLISLAMTLSAQEVTLGTQTWKGLNLDVITLNDGTPLVEAKDHIQWRKANREHRPAYAFMNFDPALGAKYGRVYNWWAASDPKIAPAGWHVPTKPEYETLIAYLGGPQQACLRLKAKSNVGSGSDEKASDSTLRGWNGLPGGTGNDGVYSGNINMKYGWWVGGWWTTSKFHQSGQSAPHYFVISSNVSAGSHDAHVDVTCDECAMSIRCVKN